MVGRIMLRCFLVPHPPHLPSKQQQHRLLIHQHLGPSSLLDVVLPQDLEILQILHLITFRPRVLFYSGVLCP